MSICIQSECVRVYIFNIIYIYIYIHTMYIYIYICTCTVHSDRERERERTKERKRQRERESISIYLYACMPYICIHIIYTHAYIVLSHGPTIRLKSLGLLSLYEDCCSMSNKKCLKAG